MGRKASAGWSLANDSHAHVNSAQELPSTLVMATATTVLESMGKPAAAIAYSAERVSNSAAEFAEVAARYRPQIFRFLLASLRDPESASQLGQFPERIERNDLAAAHRHQFAEGSLAQPKITVLETDRQQLGGRG